MNNSDRVRQVIATTFKLPVARVPADASMGKLPEWDSVGHVNLMMSIEQEFDLMLEVEDFAELTSVSTIVDYLAKHGG